jgi:transcriptional regulator with XRE-family HTH domain
MENINVILKEKGLTKQVVAKRMGLSRESLYRIINGNPTLDNLRKLAAAIGVQIWELFASNTKDFPEIGVFGVVVVNGIPHRIESKQDLETVLKAMQ